MFRRILVALDLSPSSPIVWQRAVELAQASHGHILVAHVSFQDDLDMALINGMGYEATLSQGLWDEYQDHLREEEHSRRQQMQDLVATVPTAGLTIDYDFSHGIPGQTLCYLAKSWGADLIILGRRGHSGLGELLLGSVSNYVLHHAPCSVLAVQGDQPHNSPSQPAMTTAQSA
ncbi:MAG: universal stress protein [Synechococcales cyanobacterium]